MYVSIVISNAFNLNKHFFFSFSFSLEHTHRSEIDLLITSHIFFDHALNWLNIIHLLNSLLGNLIFLFWNAYVFILQTWVSLSPHRKCIIHLIFWEIHSVFKEKLWDWVSHIVKHIVKCVIHGNGIWNGMCHTQFHTVKCIIHGGITDENIACNKLLIIRSY